MSVLQLSATLQKALINRLSKNLKGTTLQDIESFTTEAIRTETNLKLSGYEAVLSRGNISTLASQFESEERFKQNANYKKVLKIAELPEDLTALANAAAAVLNSSTLFDNFVTYLSKLENLSYKKGRGELSYAQLDSDTKLGVLSTEEKSSRDILIFKESHGDLAQRFRDFLLLKSLGIQVSDTRVIHFIKEQVDAGHLVGIFNVRLKRIFNLKSSGTYDDEELFEASVTTVPNAKLNILEMLNAMNNLFIQADYISSNAILDPDIFATAEKRVYGSKPEILVELQLLLLNQDAGNKLATISRSLNEIIDSIRGRDMKSRDRIDGVGAKKALEKFLKQVSKLSSEVKDKAELLSKGVDIDKNPKVKKALNDILANSATIETLVGARGLDSLKESIVLTIVATILGKPRPAEQISKASSKSSNRLLPLVLPTALTANSVSKTKPTKKLQPKKILATVVKQTIPKLKLPMTLTKLQNLLNARLHDRIRANMGTGQLSSVLNYRSGRLALSAKVVRMLESRQGMITAFYTYMKYPYATFSDGGRQQYPKSRDPKPLISKSIRELAGTMVANQLRAVNV